MEVPCPSNNTVIRRKQCGTPTLSLFSAESIHRLLYTDFGDVSIQPFVLLVIEAGHNCSLITIIGEIKVQLFQRMENQ